MKYIKVAILTAFIFSCLVLPVRSIYAKTLDAYDLKSFPVPEDFHKVKAE